METNVTRDLRDKQDLRNRLRSAQGHMRAIVEMIADDAPCADILHQMLAVRGAMGAIQRQLWRAYLLDEACGLQSDKEEHPFKSSRSC